MAVEYPTLDEVLAIHAHQIARYGGHAGLRDRAALEAALAMPRATFAGQDLHDSVVDHLVRGHAFVDGNKRVGLATCLVFLRLNGVAIRASDDDLVDLVLGVISGTRSKSDVAVFLADRSS